MATVKTRFSKRSKARKMRPYKKRSTKVSSKVKRYVKREINRNVEDKIVSINQTFGFGNIAESPDLNLYPVLPYSGYTSISQGVTQGTRIGNRCKVKKVLLKYVLYPANYDAVTNPNPQNCDVQIFLLRLKASPSVLPTSTQLQGLVQLGATSTSLSGNLSDIAINSWNRDAFFVKTFVHKVGFAQYAGTGGEANAQYRSNNDYKMNVIRKHDITRLVASEMVFDDNGTTHLRKNIFFGMQAVGASGGTFGATTIPMRIQYWIDIIYTDA